MSKRDAQWVFIATLKKINNIVEAIVTGRVNQSISGKTTICYKSFLVCAKKNLCPSLVKIGLS